MEVILLERVEKLGQMGSVVNVKNGYARNYLLPQKKALRATEANRVRFENDRVGLEAHNLERRSEAETISEKMANVAIVLVRQASDSGQLYGSATARDVAEGLAEAGYAVERRQINLDRPIKALGIHKVRIALHPEITIFVDVNVARTEDEAERQAAGEIVTAFERAGLAPEEVVEAEQEADAETPATDVAAAESTAAIDESDDA